MTTERDCEIFDGITEAPCTRSAEETVTAVCEDGHTASKRACGRHAHHLRIGRMGCRACAETGRSSLMTITSA
ncbi:hypothetical protein [Nonomuraea sp. NPDC003214]